MCAVGTRPSGSTAAASEPGGTSHGARTARASRAGEDIEPRRPAARRARRAAAQPGLAMTAAPAGDSGAGCPAGQVGRRHAGPQQRRHDRAGRRADDEVGPAGVPAQLVVERGEHAGVEGVADGAPGPEHDGDAGRRTVSHPGDSPRRRNPSRPHAATAPRPPSSTPATATRAPRRRPWCDVERAAGPGPSCTG